MGTEKTGVTTSTKLIARILKKNKPKKEELLTKITTLF
ncbi:uncharacterized protein G2W53_033518 [Senna tora]|uniref:Uncharacterized protein n=1 Tax=Senna tora TaxID=362788 RepID=A0A834W818_9FABA|nr:uncharacterized protein G2W53_033518 [Senna tora]